MNDQIAFDDIILSEKLARSQALAQELDRRCKSVAYSIGRAKTATILDITISYANELLNSNNETGQKHWQQKFNPALALESPDIFKREVIDFLCDICGYEHPEKKRTMTPEEELKAVKKIIKAHGLEPLFKE